jgi:hypothetical protein
LNPRNFTGLKAAGGEGAFSVGGAATMLDAAEIVVVTPVVDAAGVAGTVPDDVGRGTGVVVTMGDGACGRTTFGSSVAAGISETGRVTPAGSGSAEDVVRFRFVAMRAAGVDAVLG